MRTCAVTLDEYYSLILSSWGINTECTWKRDFAIPSDCSVGRSRKTSSLIYKMEGPERNPIFFILTKLFNVSYKCLNINLKFFYDSCLSNDIFFKSIFKQLYLLVLNLKNRRGGFVFPLNFQIFCYGMFQRP